MNDEDPLQSLIREAKCHAPFGEASAFGFETRLRSALAGGAVAGTDLSLADWFAKFSWRFSAACLPLALTFVVFLTIRHPYPLPEGVGGLVAHWMEILPLEL